MSYRSKLMIVIFATSVVTAASATGVVFRVYQIRLAAGGRDTLLAVAHVTAAFLDGDIIKSIRHEGDEKLASYAQVRESLQKARDANRGPALDVSDLCTITSAADDPALLVYGVDAEQTPSLEGKPGESFYQPNEPVQIGTNYANRGQTQFSNRSWVVTAFVPIKDRSGKDVAELEMDANARGFNSAQKQLERTGILALAAAAVLGLAIALPLSKWAANRGGWLNCSRLTFPSLF
ncbi:MAG: hypothetical protein ACLQAT_14015 [Candidatus Binataceae bacterium]